MTDLILQIALIALVVAAWADMARLRRRLARLEELLRYIYSLAYYMYYQTARDEEEGGKGGEAVVVGDEAVVGDVDKVKEACVMELIRARGCVDVQEVLDKCSVSKSFIINKLYRKEKVVSFIEGGRKICPRRT
jgi:hypothetical protein